MARAGGARARSRERMIGAATPTMVTMTRMKARTPTIPDSTRRVRSSLSRIR
jgi:hypothetical protein